MKKLMIAAAVAALIGGAQAEMVYDFTASVKTTKAKAGSSTTVKAQVGQDAPINGNWWYTDVVFTPSATANYLDYGTYTKVVKLNPSTGVGTLQVSRLDNDGKAQLAADLAAYSFPEIYKGKEKWCATWSYKVAGTCIRAKGSETIKSEYKIDDCCTDMKFTEDTVVPFLGDINLLTLYRFGGVKGDKCMNVELVGYIGKDGLGSVAYDTIPAFALAGQGTWSNTQKNSKKVVVPGIASVSGNIVGIWYEAECEVCCGLDASSLAYSCDLTQHNIGDGNPNTIGTFTDLDGIVGDDAAMNLINLAGFDEWGTAAFGTFTLKFNSKKSK